MHYKCGHTKAIIVLSLSLAAVVKSFGLFKYPLRITAVVVLTATRFVNGFTQNFDTPYKIDNP